MNNILLKLKCLTKIYDSKKDNLNDILYFIYQGVNDYGELYKLIEPLHDFKMYLIIYQEYKKIIIYDGKIQTIKLYFH